MARVTVKVESDHLEKLAKPSRRLAGVSELVWNAVDAEADEVEVRVLENALQGVQSVEVVDNGHGMSHAEALKAFELLGGSWKRHSDRSENGKRLLHGSEGQGRWRAFSIGNRVRWITVATDGGGQARQTTITGLRHSLKEFEVSDASPVKRPSGTRVVIDEIAEGAIAPLTAEGAVEQLTTEFALYLEQYPLVKITFDGRRLAPADLQERRAEYEIPAGEDEQANLTVIEWNREVPRGLFLCDENGMALGQIQPGIQAPEFSFTAYLRWPGFRELEAELATAEMHPLLIPLIDASKEKLREHFRRRREELAGALIAEWKREEVYPYEGEPLTPLDEVRREVFDVVATSASGAVNATSDRKARRFSLRLLREAIEQSPSALRRVLHEVLELPVDKLAELDDLITRTSLVSIISLAKEVKNRLDVVSGLRELLFDPESKRNLKERTQLQRILADEAWIFGDQYALAVDDQGLEAVLEKHLELLGREPAVDQEPVLREDDRRGIVDLMLSKAIRLPIQRREHLVVELKRPSVKITQKVIAQIQSYAVAVASDERFSKTEVNWNFFLISNEVDAVAEKLANQENREPGLVMESAGVKVWVRTWAQVLDDCEQRLKFVEEHLDYSSSRKEGLTHLRDVYKRLIAAPVAGE
jgi:hypothetical protein